MCGTLYNMYFRFAKTTYVETLNIVSRFISQEPLYTRHYQCFIISVPIKGVTIINVSKSTVIVDANSSLTLECKTSQPSRPKANITWGHNTVQLNSTKTNETVIYDLIEVISTLSFFPGKNMNGNNITCSGNNYLDNFKYDWVTLNVTCKYNNKFILMEDRSYVTSDKD